MKKWTKAERAEASRKAKERIALKNRSMTLTAPKHGAQGIHFVTIGAGGGGHGASANHVLAIDVVKMIGHDVPADVIVKVVERILRP